MLDHLTLIVSDYERSKAFYTAALAPLGVEIVVELTREEVPSLPCAATVGFGEHDKPELWLRPVEQGAVQPTRVAFRAGSREVVDAFHAAALQAGGTDNGPPGLRSEYHPNYYCAFVLDPDAYNIEAVCHFAPPPP